MLEAAWWGFVGGAALLVGALLGLYLKVGLRVIGLVMAFGAGVLISAVAFELTEEAYRSAGSAAAALGLAAGSVTFFTGDWLIDRQGGHRRKSPVHGGVRLPGAGGRHGIRRLAGREASDRRRRGERHGPGARGPARRHPRVGRDRHQPARRRRGGRRHGRGGVPVEHPRVDVGDHRAQGVRALDRLDPRPVGRSSSAPRRWPRWRGYALLGGASEETVAFIQTFAAGAILTMLADTMMPEAVEHAGRLVGLLTVLGFAVAFFLSAA